MAKIIALVFGAVFILSGIAGFFPNDVFGPDGTFAGGVIGSVARLVVGAILVAVALRAGGKITLTLKVLGLILLALGTIGFLLIPQGGALLGLIPTTAGDHWYHVVFGLLMIANGLFIGAVRNGRA